MVIEFFPFCSCSWLTLAVILLTPGFTETGMVTSKEPPDAGDATIAVPDSPISALVSRMEDVGDVPSLLEMVPNSVTLAAPYVSAMILMPGDSGP